MAPRWGFHIEEVPDAQEDDLKEYDYTVAGPVKITKADGTVVWEDPLDEQEYARVVYKKT